MCGGVGFKIKNIPEEELKKYYSPELIKRFKTGDRIESFFWRKEAVLPVLIEEDGKTSVQLKIWGNKDESVNLPKTGWAKDESLKRGRWSYLKPKLVNIPIDSGYEKKTWFDMPEGTKGVLVKKNSQERVYMITKQASEKYKKETTHDREPLGIKKSYAHVLGWQKKKTNFK